MRITSPGADSIVGVIPSKSSGDIISSDDQYDISNPINRRFKRLIDVISAIFLDHRLSHTSIFCEKALQMLANAVDVLDQ
jgi:hypothetical protein